ncbi:MAG: sensor domain-containing diguanylate cyclase [Desulfatibacillum sp.]|nr:sensor domain-containing diguanylate cyclase [Desulfatibacillum sp.]
MFKDDQFQKDILDNLFDGVYCVNLDRIITYWSANTEQLTGFPAREVVGRSCQDNRVMYVDNWGHNLCEPGVCPAVLTMQDGIIREINVSYHHKDGHLVPAVARILPIRDEQGQITGAVEVFQDTTPVVKEREKAKELEDLALNDPLTHVSNRTCGQARLEAKLNELRRYGWPFGVLFCDVDKFKHVNDTYGHHVGDAVLKAVAKTLSGNLRASDIVCRWGGDEFLIILPSIDLETLGQIANKVLRIVEKSRVPVGVGTEKHTITVTSSIGGTVARQDDTPESLLKRADELMYKGKKAGANRAVI